MFVMLNKCSNVYFLLSYVINDGQCSGERLMLYSYIDATMHFCSNGSQIE